MKKKIIGLSLAFTFAVGMAAVGASSISYTDPVEAAGETKTIYCKVDKSWWTIDGAAVGVHYWNGTDVVGTSWPGYRMSLVEGETNVWSYDVPANALNCIFTRVNPSGSIADWGAKTKDLTIPTDGKNLFTITSKDEVWGDPGCDGEWSTYVPTTPSKYYVSIGGREKQELTKNPSNPNEYCLEDIAKFGDRYDFKFYKDEEEINHFIKYVKTIQKMELPLEGPIDSLSLLRLFDLGSKYLPIVPTLVNTNKMTKEEYARNFKHPALRYAFSHCAQGANNFFCFLYTYANFVSGNCALPKGGSLKMAKNIEEKFKHLGGKITFNTPVKEIIIKKKKAIGVELEDGSKDFGNYVIAACDAIYTLKKLLKKEYYDFSFVSRFNKPNENPTPTCVQVCLLVEGDAQMIDTPIEFPIETIRVGLRNIKDLNVRNYNYEKELYSKDGITLITVLIDQYQNDFMFWNNLKKNNLEEYQNEKKRIAFEVITAIENKYQELKGKISQLDVFTPATLNRYVNATNGAYMPFSFTSKNSMLFHNQKIKDLKNFYIASQWTQTPGGLPLAITTGKFAIQKILFKEFNVVFFFKKIGIILSDKLRRKIIITNKN